MKATDNFKNIINNYLKSLALKDALFSKTLSKPNKNIEDCITYILNKVKESGCNAFSDEEVFSMAVHYYDEDELNVGNIVKANIIINQPKAKVEAKVEAKAVINIDPEQTSLF